MENFEVEQLQLTCSALSDHRVLQLRQEVEALKPKVRLEQFALIVETSLMCIEFKNFYPPCCSDDYIEFYDNLKLNGEYKDSFNNAVYTVDGDYIIIEREDLEHDETIKLHHSLFRQMLNQLAKCFDDETKST